MATWGQRPGHSAGQPIRSGGRPPASARQGRERRSSEGSLGRLTRFLTQSTCSRSRFSWRDCRVLRPRCFCARAFFACRPADPSRPGRLTRCPGGRRAAGRRRLGPGLRLGHGLCTIGATTAGWRGRLGGSARRGGPGWLGRAGVGPGRARAARARSGGHGLRGHGGAGTDGAGTNGTCTGAGIRIGGAGFVVTSNTGAAPRAGCLAAYSASSVTGAGAAGGRTRSRRGAAVAAGAAGAAATRGRRPGTARAPGSMVVGRTLLPRRTTAVATEATRPAVDGQERGDVRGHQVRHRADHHVRGGDQGRAGGTADRHGEPRASPPSGRSWPPPPRSRRRSPP